MFISSMQTVAVIALALGLAVSGGANAGGIPTWNGPLSSFEAVQQEARELVELAEKLQPLCEHKERDCIWVLEMLEKDRADDAAGTDGSDVRGED